MCSLGCTEHPRVLRREALGFKLRDLVSLSRQLRCRMERALLSKARSPRKKARDFVFRCHACVSGKMKGRGAAPRDGRRRFTVDRRKSSARGTWKGPD